MEFYFQIKDSVNGNYYNGRNGNGITWTKDAGKKMYHNIPCCHDDATSILKHSMGGRGSVIIVKRYKVNDKWLESVLKVVTLHRQEYSNFNY